jgi:chemotaxis protein MotB
MPRVESSKKYQVKDLLRNIFFNIRNEFYRPNWKIIFYLIIFISATSCVSTKKLIIEQEKSKRAVQSWSDCEKKYEILNKEIKELSDHIIKLENQLANEQNKYNLLEQQLEYFKLTNTNLLDRLSDLAIVSKTGAESIKKSLDAINGQNLYIKDLTSAMRTKDSLNLALVMNLKKSLIDITDEDVNIEVKKGVVYISISDKLLFKSGSSEISQRAEEVLGKIARVLNDQKQLDILVEGHTDTDPISTGCITDNWDLSVKRATTVVRYLQTKHSINPERMTAGGRSEFVPKTSNSTVEGKTINRRTEIIVLPQLDQFFQSLEPPTN